MDGGVEGRVKGEGGVGCGVQRAAQTRTVWHLPARSDRNGHDATFRLALDTTLIALEGAALMSDEAKLH
jgi:hypothetical protein